MIRRRDVRVTRAFALAAPTVVALCLGAALGCQHGPTRGGESRERPYALVQSKVQRPIEINERTVVLDARSAFDFGLSRVRGAIHFPWDRLAESRATGEFLRDPRRVNERLALAGVTPDTPVVVVGYGPRGRGDEGRLAWTLLSLGIRDVQVTANESLRKLWTQDVPTPARNASPSALAHRADAELSAADFKGLASSLEDLKNKRIWLIDVRSAKEYLTGDPLAGSLNVEWTEFYTNEGRPNRRVAKRLATVDVRPDDRVILISPRGVRAAAAAYALYAAGFQAVQIYRR